MVKRSNYRLLGLVGQGQYGQVFCAVSRQTGRLVALKHLDHQRFSTHKFLRELRFLLSLCHPNIVACQSLEHLETGRHLVMDYCEGGTLRSLMTEENWLSLPQSLKIVSDVLAGLAHAHDRGIIHCDIKPENILLTVQPDGWTAQISDFGIARLSQEEEGRSTGNTGSPAYMAPERFYGEYSLTSDLYSVGVLLFELLAGHRPFAGTPAELMSAHLNQPLQIPESIVEPWRSVLTTALQKLSARRFRSAEEMRIAIQAIASPHSSSISVPSASNPNASNPDASALFQPVTAPACQFQAQWERALTQPVRALALNDSSLYQASLDQVIRQCQTSAPFAPPGKARLAGLLPTKDSGVALNQKVPHAVESLALRPQGCFVMTARSVHQIADNSQPVSLLTLPQDSAIAIAPQGDWLAALTPQTLDQLERTEYSLRFQRLNGRSIGLAQVSLPWKPDAPAPQLLALDAGHVAIAIQLSGSALAGTLIKIFTRRGSFVGDLVLPLQMERAILTQTPYQLVAIDRHHPQLLTVVDLKPYRIRRLAAGIAPAFLSVIEWGYIVASARQIALLDLEGRQVGLMTAPAPVTAIAPFGNRLLVATWEGQQGQLYALDLREVGADLLF